MHILGGCIYCKSLVTLIKSTLFNWVMYIFFANAFFPSKFPQIRQSLLKFVQGEWLEDILFLQSVKQKLNFPQTFRWQEIPRRKTSKSYDTTAVRNDPGNKTKKIVNLILENGMLKAIIEVYFELLVTNFYAQISWSCHSMFVKIITILMHHTASTLFAYITFSTSTRMFWLVTCPAHLGQK